MEQLSNDHKELPSQCKDSHRLCNEKGNPLLSWKENQLKLRQQHDQIFPMERNHYRTNTQILTSEEISKCKRGGL